ncbi:uncharacterized protein SOCE836_060240 [Sorangium cellulosum]|uniref:Uncharacterized protein n=1 Tax=Sorangium cellulosum TaxID=56 RepID=A0A4P2QU43_SORCE|nr:uncharacterized protein SOCE836_060240 [Sorangium cellulosum]
MKFGSRFDFLAPPAFSSPARACHAGRKAYRCPSFIHGPFASPRGAARGRRGRRVHGRLGW